MADYKIEIGAELRTGDIDKKIKGHNAPDVKVGVDLKTEDITKRLNGYRAQNPIEVNSKLSTKGITEAIKNYKAKKIVKVDSDVNTSGIEDTLKTYVAKTPIKVDVKLNRSSINQEISDYNNGEHYIVLKAKLDDDAVNNAINSYQNNSKAKPIKIKVEPDFDDAETKISNYTVSKPINVKVNVLKKDILNELKAFQSEEPNNYIMLNAKLVDGAVNKAILEYKTKYPEKIKFPIDLTLGDTSNFDNLVAQKRKTYEQAPIFVPVKLKPASQGFESRITSHAIPISATLDPDNINTVIKNFVPINKIKVGVRLVPKNVNEQVKKIAMPTEVFDVGVKLNESSINNAITAFHPTALLDVGVHLKTDDINQQIEAIHPTSPVKVNVDLDNSDINAEAGKQKTQTPITLNVKLDREDINDQIRRFTTKTKIKVGVKLDFASHKNEDGKEIQKGIAKQIKDYQTKTKIKVNVELDRNSINQEIQNIQVNTPIRLGVELDPNGVQNVNNRLDNIRQQIQALGNVNINFGGNGAGGNDGGNGGRGGRGGRQQVDEVTQAYRDLMGVLRELDSKRLSLNRLTASSPQASREIQTLRLQIEQLENEYNNLINSFNVQGIQFTAAQWNEIETAMARVGRRVDVIQSKMADKSAVQSQTQAYRELMSISKEIGSLETNIAKLRNQGGNTNQIAQLENQLRNLQATYQQLVTSMSTPLTADQWSAIYTQITKTQEELEKIRAKYADTRAEFQKKIKADIGTGSLKRQVNDVAESFDLLRIKNQDVEDDITRLRTLLGNMDSGSDIEAVISDYEEFLQLLSKVKNSVKELQREQNNSGEMLDLKKSSAMETLNGLFEKGSQAAKIFGGRANQLAKELNACGNANVDNVVKKIQQLGTEVKNSHLQTKTFGSRLKEQFSKYSQYLSIASVFQYGEQAIRSMFEQVKLIDSAMTELKKVTNETDVSYNRFLSNAASKAKELGTTIDGLVSSTADFARLGYGFEDAQGLAEVANIYAVVGDEIEGVEDATQSLVSTLAAFKDEMGSMKDDDFALSIVDKMNEVANNYAISSGGIGEALQRSASSMAAANNSLDETIAMITAANTVTQNPEKVGNAMKTISMRIRGAVTELEEAGESTEGMAESTAKLREEMLALSGVDIMLNENTFKSTYQIMDELSKKWKDLSDIAQASIIELMAGKHQGNVMSSLMANFDIARDALETSLGSSGSAMAEHAKWSQSLEARLNSLKASWQSLSQSFLNSDFLKFILDGVIKLIDALDKLIDTFGTVPTILGAIAIGKFASNLLTLGEDVKSFNNILDILSMSFPNVSNVVKAFFGTLKGGSGIFAALGSGAKALWSVIAQHPILAVAAAVGIAVVAYNKWNESAEELAERIEETTFKYKEQRNALIKIKGDYDTSNEDSMISKYGKLSKGVNALGENISLTADEYSEYQDIVNTIADQIPSLVTGYNSQGDAILGCAGNVDKLSGSYENLIKKQNAEILKSGADIFKDFNNDLERSSGYDGYVESATSHLKELEKLLLLTEEAEVENGKDLETALADASYDEIWRISELLENNGYKRDVIFGDGLLDFSYESQEDFIARVINKDRTEIKSILDAASKDINAYAEDLSLVTEAYFSDAFLGDYSHISDRMQNIISQVTSSFGSTFYEQFIDKENPEKSYEALTKYYDTLLNVFDNLSDSDTKEFEAAFDLQTQFNGGKISYGEYVNGIQNAGSLIDRLDLNDETKNQIKLSLNTDEVNKNYDTLKTRLTSDEYNIKMKSDEAEEFLNNLTASEYSVAVDLVTSGDFDFGNFDEFKKYIEKQAKLKEALNYTIGITVETESLDALNTAMAESVSGAGLSSEAIAALKGRYADLESQGYNLSAMFEETSNGIHLNREAVSELEQALASQKLSETQGHLDTLKGRYDEVTKKIDECTDASERAALYTEQQTIVEKINDLATLAAQYEGLTSAYNAWQSAESAGSERDMYESVIEGFENIGDEISRGWYDDGTIKFLELITGKTDLAGESASDLKKIWKDLDNTIEHTTYSVKDFFTVDEDGNTTSKGVYNFLDAIGQMEEEKFLDKDGKPIDVIKRKNGKIIGFDFELVAQKDKNGNVIKNGDQVIAEALGISEELVQIMLRASDDAGFVVNLDGAYTQLADLKTEAEAARDSLISLKKEGNLKDVIGRNIDKDVNFDLDAEGNDLVTEQAKAVELLNKFKKDGKIDLSVKGAQEALDIAEYLTIKLDDLTEPKFMQIDTSEVQEDLRDPIEKMQEIGRLCKEKHLVTLTGDTKELKEVQGEIDKVAKELEGLEKDEKIKVGIDPEWDDKTIADKIEKGEIEIPAKLELDVQMSEDLKDMRLLMMRQLGLVSEEEIKLKIGYEVDESTVDNLTPDEQKVAVKFIAENEDEFDKLSDEEKQVVVDIVTDDSALKALEEHGVEIEAFCRIFGVEKVDDLKAKLEQLDDEQILVLAEVLGRVNVEKLKTTVAGLDDKTVEAIAKALGEGDVNGLKTVINGLDDKTVQAIAEAFGYSGVDELNKAIENLDPKTVQAIAEALGITDVDSLRNAINRLTNKDVEAAATVSGKDDVNSLKSAIDNLKGKTITVWASIKKKASNLWDKLTGGGGVDGTAHVNGTAFANGTVVKKSGKAFKQGDWGTKDSGVALGGEEAPELLVRNGRWHLIGEKGAEFFGYRKGDIIFNASQTKEIFEKGKITHGNGRGKALVSGTAFSSGSDGGEEITIGVNKNTGASYTKSTDKDDFEETIDWIESAIDRIERAIGQLDTKANSTYRSWSERNGNLAKQISRVGDEIALQQSAYEEYMAAANAVGLSSSWAKKVRNGEVDIETIKDEGLKAKIDDYQNWYNKALDCKDAILKLKETESSLYAQRFENVQTQYDGILQGYEHTEAMLNEYISQAEAQGHIISKKYYQALIDNERKNISALEDEQSALLAKRQEYYDAMRKQGMTDEEIKSSEQWIKMSNEIDGVTQAIENGETAILGYAKSMKEIDWDTFDMKQQHISDVTDESDFLIDLMSNKDLHDDKGKLTAQGAATLGLHGLNHNTYMYQADDYAKEIADIDRRIKLDKNNEDYLDPNSKDVINRRRELVGLQRESILAAEDEKQAIKDLVQDGIDKELDALQELIDKKNEELESEKDLYEYQKKVKEQTEEIASLEKQMAAYSGDDSEESKAKIQELKVSLEDAKENLKETEWDKYIQDTSALLDTLYTEYETILNTRLDNIDDLLSQVITGINAGMGDEGAIATALSSGGAIAQSIMNAMGENGSMKTILNTEANNVGTTLSTAMNNIWSVGEGNAKSVLTTYGDDFQSKQTTTNTTLSGIKASVDAMVDDVDKEAQKKTTANKTTTSAKKNPTKTTATTNKNTTTTQKKTTTNKKSSGDGKPKIGDKVKFVSGQYYYDSQGKKPLGSKYKGKQVYITNINTRDWATHGYHISTGNKLGKGDLGWLKLNQISGYAAGKKNFLNDEIAWTQENGREFIIRPSDGAILTPVAKGDSVLNAAASGNIWSMANNPAEFIKNNLGLDSANVPSGANVQNSCIQNFENITFSMPNVRNYEQLVSEMQKDPKFEKLILAMTVDQIAGKSKLSKNKVIR